LVELKQQLSAWRRQTKDPLLNPENLRRLAQEVQGLTRKQARRYEWGYPDYFFGMTPRPRPAIQPPTGTSAKKKTQ
ncbi:MAG: hypothetical protein ACYTAS_07295, partial [Planctomycetota bacterium]